eukprot:snap_masked-scaffold_17-processed-gene-3.16-mRNA-1 protein AED:1.00 eAED:1.00 QI:0/0/0/0/1/1/2/0/81
MDSRRRLSTKNTFLSITSIVPVVVNDSNASLSSLAEALWEIRGDHSEDWKRTRKNPSMNPSWVVRISKRWTSNAPPVLTPA